MTEDVLAEVVAEALEEMLGAHTSPTPFGLQIDVAGRRFQLRIAEAPRLEVAS
jgi:hypothetical protein